MLRNRAILVGFGDGPQDPKNSLEIQGFVPCPVGPVPSPRIWIQEHVQVAGDDL